MTPVYLHPGVYIEEPEGGDRTIEGVATSIAAFVGCTPRGPSNVPRTVRSFPEFEREFGQLDVRHALAHAVDDFFRNGGSQALIVRVFKDDGSSGGLPPDEASYKAAFDALNQTDMFNLLCLPPYDANGDVDAAILQHALKLCVDRRALLIVDPRSDWFVPNDVLAPRKGLAALGLSGEAAGNAAVYFPRITKADLACSGHIATFVPCGAVAGVIARTDAQQGVWKAPAGPEATIKAIQGLSLSLTKIEIDQLNAQGVNCIRSFSACGPVLWGARTLRGNDQPGEDYKYIPIRRLSLFIEETLRRGTQCVVFEPNDEQLWEQIRQSVDVFMQSLFRRGAFKGLTPREAYFVKCDKVMTTLNDINLGIVNIVVGFAPLKAAEFVILNIQQIVGQIEA